MIWKRRLFLLAVLTMILGSWKGYVALFEKNASEPTQIFPCPVRSLPEADQSALEEGIYIGTSDELSRRLEDYLS